ncbi:MAG: hypothetical protein GMKNLPBB_01176 [Myxococcota bacterium]|nr:hypothetical protein [Myxococcota bacterium]
MPPPTSETSTKSSDTVLMSVRRCLARTSASVGSGATFSSICGRRFWVSGRSSAPAGGFPFLVVLRGAPSAGASTGEEGRRISAFSTGGGAGSVGAGRARTGMDSGAGSSAGSGPGGGAGFAGSGGNSMRTCWVTSTASSSRGSGARGIFLDALGWGTGLGAEVSGGGGGGVSMRAASASPGLTPLDRLSARSSCRRGDSRTTVAFCSCRTTSSMRSTMVRSCWMSPSSS